MYWTETAIGSDLSPCCAATVQRFAKDSVGSDSLRVGNSIACSHCPGLPTLLNSGGLAVWTYYLEPKPRRRRRARAEKPPHLGLIGVRQEREP